MTRKGAALAAGVVVTVVVALAVQTHREARAALGRAEDAHARGDERAAVAAAGDAARGRAPLSGVRDRALSLLGTIAHDAEGRGDLTLARAAAEETLAAERASAWPGGSSPAAKEAQGTLERLAKKQGTALPAPPPPPPRWPPLLAASLVVLAALGLRRIAAPTG